MFFRFKDVGLTARRKLAIGLFIMLGMMMALGVDTFRFLNRNLDGPEGVRDLVVIVASQLKDPVDIKEEIRSRFPSLFNAIREKVREFDKEFPDAGKSLNLPQFELVLSRNDVAHFDQLYKKYNDPAHGVEYYSKANQWRKGRLTYQGKTYRVKVKAHGRQPSQHQEGRYISLAIKLKKGEQINNSRRFSLIVRSKLPPDRYVILKVSKQMGLLTQENDLVRLKINNWDDKVYLFVPRLDDKFMEARKAPSLRRYEYSLSPIASANKSLIVNMSDADPAQYETMLEATLVEAGVSDLEMRETLDRFRALNETITAGDYRGIGQFFDHDYISTLDAIQTIFGFPGHGWVSGNFHIFYNTSNGLFYPVVTRDNLHNKLDLEELGTPERQVNTYLKKGDHQLWKVLSRNDDIRQLKYDKIYEFSEHYTDARKDDHVAMFSSLRRLHYYGRLKETLIGMGLFQENFISDNLHALTEYLERSEPEARLWKNGSRIAIEIAPGSMSALRLDKLTLGNVSSTASEVGTAQIALSMKNGTHSETRFLPDFSYHMVDGQIDFSKVVDELRFSDFLDTDLNRSPRSYVLTLQVEGVNFDTLTWRNISLGLTNVVTQKSVESISRVERDKAGVMADVSTSLSFPAFRLGEKTALQELRTRFPHISMQHIGTDSVAFQSGTYRIVKDFILPKGIKLHLNAGTKLLLGEGVALVGYEGVVIRGTEQDPVIITAVDPDKPFGSVGFLGGANTYSDISYLDLSYGSEIWVEGAFFSGGLSIHYNSEVRIANSTIHHNRADDGLNIKYAQKVTIVDSVFANNFADQVDLDIVVGEVERTQFLNTEENDGNGDGLDVSGSEILIKNSSFHGFDDKGLSVGEDSTVWVQDTKFENNLNGVAVKDLSQLFLITSEFESNTTDITAYQKKDHFGGGFMYVAEQGGRDEGLSYKLDDKSMLFSFPSNAVVGSADRIESQQAMDEAISNILQYLDESGTASAPHPEGYLR